MTLTHRSYRGKIAYLHEDRGELGREWFHVTVDTSGTRTLRCMVEMDPEALVRDVVLTVDKAWRPQESYIRLNQDGAFKGAAWYRFLENRAMCKGENLLDGRFTQSVALDRPAPGFGTHALMTDGWQASLFDHSQSENPQIVPDHFTTSPEPDGSSGPRLECHEHKIEYAGEDEIEVPVGQYKAGHYLIHLSRPDWPPLEIWVTPEDFQLLRLSWPVTRSRYDLVQVEGDFA